MLNEDNQTETLLNEEQLKAVYFDTSDVVIVAGAGSGKTTVLASRIMHLLIDKHVSIDNILCLTFTKKATAEMYARIHFLLQQSIQSKRFNDTPLSDTTIEFLRAQEENFHKSHILTLDAFSLRIAHIGLSRLGIISEPMVEDSLEPYVYAFIEAWLLEHEDSNIKDLLQLFRFNELISHILVPLLSECSCIENSLLQDHNSIIDLLEKQIHRTFQSIVHITQNLISTINEAKNSVNITPSLSAFFNTADKLSRSLSAFQVFDILEFEDFNLRFAIKNDKETERSLKTFAHTIRELQNIYNCSVLTYQNKDYYKKYYLELQPLVDDWVYYQKNTLGIFSHTNIAELARYTLSTYPDIRFWYSTQYRYIIIDEFQDNNIDQKNLLYTIKDVNDCNNHYFFVGDPKQSIYKFRGADIRAFLSLTENPDNAILHMKNNYRSTPPLIHVFNTWFTTLFNDDRINTSIQYEIQSTPSNDSTDTATQGAVSKMFHNPEHSSELQQTSCLVEMINDVPHDVELINSNSALEAYAISKRIATMIDLGIPVQDIAVLSRTKSIFLYIAQYLRKQNIPYIMEDSVVALRQDIGIDFHAWLSLLAYPEDRSAYATILRSPLLHISDELVVALLSYSTTNLETRETQEPFYIPVQEANEHPILINTIYKNSKDLKKIALLKEKYHEIKMQLTHNISLLDIFQHFWIECGYRYILLRNIRYQVFLSQYEIIKTIIINHQKNGLIAFIDLLQDILEGKSLEIKTLNTDEVAAVKIMSIHKSKGLEFPYVILANMGGSLSASGGREYGRFVKKEHINYLDLKTQDTSHYLLKNSESSADTFENFYRSTIKEAQKNTHDELLRVLYVGMTRAKKGLVLLGTYKPKSKESINTFFDWLINHNLILPNPTHTEHDQDPCAIHNEHVSQVFHDAVDLDRELEEGFTAQESSSNLISTIVQEELSSPVLKTFNNRIEITPSSNSPTLKHRSKNMNLPKLRIDATLNKYNMHTAFGTYCHYLLSYYTTHRIPKKIPIKLETQLLPLSEKDTKLFFEDAEMLSQQFLKSNLWQNLDSQASARMYPEHPFLMWNKTHQVFVRGIIDLLVITDTQIQIIDYKVDKARHPEKYMYQMSAYIHATRKMLNTPPQSIQCHIYYLRDGNSFFQEHIAAEDDLVAFLLSEDNMVEENQLLVDDNIEFLSTHS